eukprot:TRINITY_DN2145_c1_g1_i1.p1 TRINITY_DN2145_c1_g1~~TRINITY_DN2145_c1_g1_i1.p1  ORF type:complete len:363 (+),score=73.89 TRINITY_DN2145_c1_g1_i1:40-1089(+)
MKHSTENREIRLTCNTCRVVFDEISEQRNHFKEDFHRFNLKRKAAGLAPIGVDVFDKLLVQIQRDNQEEEELSWLCNVCNKKYANFMSMQQHLNSNRHKELAEEVEVEEVYSPLKVEDHESESMDDEEFDQMVEDFINDPQTLCRCLFCSNVSDDFESNMDHMTHDHKFIIPLAEYLSDLEGLFCYLATKVHIAYMCITCPYSGETGRVFSSTRGCQAHMLDKGHINFDPIEYEDEYHPFYDLDRYYEQISNVANLREADIDFQLPSGKVVVNRQYSLYYKRNESKEIVSLEKTDEEKQLIAYQKTIRIQTQKTKKQSSMHRKRELKSQLFGNKLLRRRFDQGTANINH